MNCFLCHRFFKLAVWTNSKASLNGMPLAFVPLLATAWVLHQAAYVSILFTPPCWQWVRLLLSIWYWLSGDTWESMWCRPGEIRGIIYKASSRTTFLIFGYLSPKEKAIQTQPTLFEKVYFFQYCFIIDCINQLQWIFKLHHHRPCFWKSFTDSDFTLL